MAARKLKADGLVVTCEQKPLLEALEPAAEAADRRASIPILACVRLAAEGGHLCCTGTDMDLQVEATCSAMVEGEGMACCDAKLLLAAVKAAGPEVRLAREGDRLAVSGGDCRSRLAAMEADEFPAFAAAEGRSAAATWPGDLLQRLLGRCRPAVANEETRYYLNGVFLTLAGDGGAALVSTDGHRLVKVVGSLDEASGSGSGILPTRAVDAARKLPGSVSLMLWERQARLSAGPVTLVTRLVDGTFPDYQRVVPPEIGRWRARVDRDLLLAAVRRVAWAAGDDKARPVAFELHNQVLHLTARDGEGTAEARAELAAEIEGPTSRVGFNAKYLIEMLGSAPAGPVTLSGANAEAPWRIDPDEDAGDHIVVMPMLV